MDVTKDKPKKLKKFDVMDMKLFKIGAVAFTLMAAKLWAPLLRLEWYWYAGVFALAMVRPFYKVVSL